MSRTKAWKNLSGGQLEAALNKLEAQGGVASFLQGKTKVATDKKWSMFLGVIDLGIVVSNGMSGPDWVLRLERQGYRLSEWAKDLLLSPKFVSTSGKVTQCAALHGGFLFTDDERITKNIRAEATRRKMAGIDMETACLLREQFSDEDLESMGLNSLIVMHKPVEDFAWATNLLTFGRGCDGQRMLDASYGRPDVGWSGVIGFVFAVPQASR